MKKIIYTLLLSAALVMPSRPSHAIIFPLLDALITPLPVFDASSMGTLIANYVQQVMQVVKSIEQAGGKAQETIKLVSSGATSLTSIQMPSLPFNEIKTAVQGASTGITALKAAAEKAMSAAADAASGVTSGIEDLQAKAEGILKKNVDLTKPEEIADAVQPQIMVSKAVGVVEEQIKKDRRTQFKQENIQDILARVLYMKYELEQLQKTEAALTSLVSTPDTAGSVSVPPQLTEVENKIKTLQQKIAASRSDLQGVLGILQAETTPEPIEISDNGQG